MFNPSNMQRYAADLNAVRDASRRIAPHAPRAPVLTCATLDALAGRKLFFKCENFQKVGAFKFRGACNAVLRLSGTMGQHDASTAMTGGDFESTGGFWAGGTVSQPEPEPCEGDANRDGTVDPLDSGYVLARFGGPVGTGDASCDAADQNGDGAVDPLDSGFVLARFGTCP